MKLYRNDPDARKQALAAELDAIVARRARGEITPEAAEALSDAAMRRAAAETTAWVRTTQEGRAHQRRLRLIVVLVALVIGAVAFAVMRYQV